MKKLVMYAILVAFASLNIFASCEEDMKKEAERRKASKVFMTENRIYSHIDSTYTGISVFVGELKNGHKYAYHLYEGKNKCQLVPEHLIDECKMCKKNDKRN